MSVKIKLTKRNLLLLEQIFRDAPKTYQEALKAGKIPPIPKGKKYIDFEKESKILKNILHQHEEKSCSCVHGKPCYYARYLNNEITVSEILTEIKS